MLTKMRTTPQLFLIVLALVLIACMPPTPIPVYITVTPEPPTVAPTTVPTLEPLPSSTPALPAEPTTDSAAQAMPLTDTPAGEPSRTPVIIGAIVGPNYTLQPSNTPRPTRTAEITIPPRPTDTPPGPSPTPLPQLDPSRVGIQLNTNVGRAEWDEALARATEMGVGWIKVQVNWAFLQPNGYDPTAEVLRTLELNLETADQRGFKILLSIAKAPNYTRSVSGEAGPPDNPQTLVDFLNLLFRETKIGQVTDAIEVWNEPNLVREWTTSSYAFSGAGYMQLFAPAYQAIRAYRQDITIVTAALAPTGTNGNFSIDDRDYLQQMYNAGLSGYQDVVIGIHPYGWGNPPDTLCCDPIPDRGWDDNPHFFFLNNLNDTRAIMNANGHQSVPLWVTEFGWATWQDLSVGLPDPQENNLWMNYNSPQQQAEYTLRALAIAQQERTDIGMMILWNLNFAHPLSVQNRDEVIAYTLLIPGQSPRPLFYLLPLAFRSGG